MLFGGKPSSRFGYASHQLPVYSGKCVYQADSTHSILSDVSSPVLCTSCVHAQVR